MTGVRGLLRAPMPLSLLLLLKAVSGTPDGTAPPESPALGTTQIPGGSGMTQSCPAGTSAPEGQMGTSAVPPTAPPPTPATTRTETEAAEAATGPPLPTSVVQTGTAWITESVKTSESGSLLASSQPPASVGATIPARPRIPGELSPQILPATPSCQTDEYLSLTPEPHCVCNHSHYTRTGMLDPVNGLFCQDTGIEVHLSRCFLETFNFNLSDPLFPGCPGLREIFNEKGTLIFDLGKEKNKCGLETWSNGTHLLHSMVIHLPPAPSGSTANQLGGNLNFTCANLLVTDTNEVKPRALLPLTDSQPTVHIIGSGYTSIYMNIYSDSQCLNPLKGYSVTLNSHLCLLIQTPNMKLEGYVMLAESIQASDSLLGESSNSVTFYFVKDGCLVDTREGTKLISNGDSLEVKMAFRMFHFRSSDVIYLHSQVRLCENLQDKPCLKTCSKSNSHDRSSRHIDDQELLYGPVLVQEPKNKGNPTGSWSSWILLVLLGARVVNQR